MRSGFDYQANVVLFESFLKVRGWSNLPPEKREECILKLRYESQAVSSLALYLSHNHANKVSSLSVESCSVKEMRPCSLMLWIRISWRKN